MGEIDKEKEVMVIYVNKSQYLIGNLRIMGLDYWKLKYRGYKVKRELGLGNLAKKGLLKEKPKTEVLKVFGILYLTTN